VGVVVLPDVRGLYRFYEELALRFAERGIAAVVALLREHRGTVPEGDRDLAGVNGFGYAQQLVAGMGCRRGWLGHAATLNEPESSYR
jgi:dienelactone hydrolase